ncbi:MAG: hypothetical protein EA425_11780 [Puniceicoccaceae bacterium]|nr:MAG: hypothetical protein EA425_11780 [Puniceicoccaceae bacterium]
MTLPFLRCRFAFLSFALLLLSVGWQWLGAGPFTYQGKLILNGEVVEGPVTLLFRLYDSPAGFNQIGATLLQEEVAVEGGVFTTALDFGPHVFTGTARWLEITVNNAVLSPRQSILPAPMAQHAPSDIRADGSLVAAAGVMAATAVPLSGPGDRLQWNAPNASFRAGSVSGDHWDPENLGLWSFAAGMDARASGENSFAFGRQAVASGPYATALGGSNLNNPGAAATASYGIAMGMKASASGTGAVAIGVTTSTAVGTTASGVGSVALGSSSVAEGPRSFAVMGGRAEGSDSLAIGGGSLASGLDAIAFKGAEATERESFAIGKRARANHQGAVVIDANGPFGASNIISSTTREMTLRGPGGVRVVSNSSATPAGVELKAGAGSWSNLSDRNAKHHFTAVDVEAILTKVAGMEIFEWSYREAAAGVRHLGPTAQDFHAAFGLGTDDRTIATVDLAGVALAAIQALEQRTHALEVENAALRRQLEDRRDAASGLEERLARLEARLPGIETAAQAGNRP